MPGTGWRTIIADHHEKFSLSNGNLVMTGAEELSIPISQLRDLLISTPHGMLSVPLLHALMENHVNVVFCDGTYTPACTVLPLDTGSACAGCLMDQAGWTQERKDAVWTDIIRQKIGMQTALLRAYALDAVPQMELCLSQLLPGDTSNREGMAARLYFASLFGSGFVRHAPDAVNASLNYGYAILYSAISRIIALHGYSTALGIHHCSRANRINLACDIVEPFRPFVDRVVFRNVGKPFDLEYKKQLIALLQENCRFDGRRMKLADAMALFTLHVLKSMKEAHPLGEVGFL